MMTAYGTTQTAIEAMKRGGVAGEIAFRLQEEAPEMMASLKTPCQTTGGEKPASCRKAGLESDPSAESIVVKVREMVGA
jgi:hypothetical protein